MGSRRLPGKVLLDIAGQPMLAHVAARTRRAQTVAETLIATTTDPADEPIAAFCEAANLPCYRGSPADVLDRYYQAARASRAEAIVRLTGDCPLIDPDVIDHTVNEFYESGVDFAANRLPPPWHRTYPIGLDTEVCSFAALERAWKEARQPHQREHVMPYLYEEEGRFRTLLVNHDPDYGHYRWTVDTAADLDLLRRIFAHFPGQDDFSWLEVVALFEREPDLAAINAHIQHKRHGDTEL